MRADRWAVGAIGVIALILLWWFVAATHLVGTMIPTPVAVVQSIAADGWGIYERNFSATVSRGLQGYLWGNLIAIALALIVVILPPLEIVATQLAILSYCTPLVAIAPLVSAVFQAQAATVFLAAISVVFTTLVGTLTGLRSADRAGMDLVRAYGGGRVQQVLRVQLISALPNTLAALKIAAPAALLGAVLGEYMGGVDTGIGPFLTQAQSSLNAPRTWAIALVAGLLAGIGYAIVALVSRLVAPWVRGART